MKKLLSFILVAVMVIFAFAGCSKNEPEAELITDTQAKEVAVEQVEGATVEEVSDCTLTEDNQLYQVVIMHDIYQFDINVNALDGTVVAIESETVTAGNSPADGEDPLDMGKEEIKKIVLADLEEAGLEELDSAKITKCLINEKDGKYSYEVVITVGESNYTYDVDASTGEIIEAGEIIESE